MDEERDRDRSRDQALVDRFILNRIDSVPHLEALLLLWRTRPEDPKAPLSVAGANPAAEENPSGPIWTPEQLAKRLWITPDVARNVLRDLEREQLIAATAKGDERYCYLSDPERDRVVQAVELTYAQEMIRISNMIHSKASVAIRDFARAFRFTKEQE
jgi:hypothetical protein